MVPQSGSDCTPPNRRINIQGLLSRHERVWSRRALLRHYGHFQEVISAWTLSSDIAASQFLPAQIDRADGGGVGIVPAEAATGNYFSMLGIEAALGRNLPPSGDVSRGGHLVVMLDYRYWQSACGGDPDVIGREMRVGGRKYTVIGVGPADFTGRCAAARRRSTRRT